MEIFGFFKAIFGKSIRPLPEADADITHTLNGIDRAWEKIKALLASEMLNKEILSWAYTSEGVAE